MMAIARSQGQPLSLPENNSNYSYSIVTPISITKNFIEPKNLSDENSESNSWKYLINNNDWLTFNLIS